MPTRPDDWIEDDEYPDERDIADLGEDSPRDDDPLTIGYVGKRRRQRWSARRIAVTVIVVILLLSFIAAEMVILLNR
jgi:hypothetical protein